MNRTPPRVRVRALAAIAAASATLLVGALPAAAGIKESQSCRKTIANSSKKVLETAMKYNGKCHLTEDKSVTPPGSRGLCNVATTAIFDPKDKFESDVTKADDKIDGAKGKCLSVGEPVLANYFGGDPTPLLSNLMTDAATGTGGTLLGASFLNADKAKVACHKEVEKARTAIIKEIVKDAVKCQNDLDKAKTDPMDLVGALDAGCPLTADKAEPKALAKIDTNQPKSKCAGVIAGGDGSSIGSCSPFPACVIDSATTTGANMAKAIFNVPPPVCGDGNVDVNETCDDGNLTPGDGCDASCQSEGGFTCSPVGGTRTVTISLTGVPADTLAGVQINLEYPQFQSGIPGTGVSSIVQSRFTALQPVQFKLMNDKESDLSLAVLNVSDFFDDGPIAQLTFDSCAALSLNFCNRSQNITGCTPVGEPTVGCPADNVCISQTVSTSCTVSDPSDINGQPVAGVGCSVSITEP